MESEVAGGNVERMSGAVTIELDVIGENCPMPLLKAKRKSADAI